MEKWLFKASGKVMTEIFVDNKKKTVSVVNHTDIPILRAFGNTLNPTYHDFEDLLESRCFPRNRDNLQWYLDQLGIDHYDPLLIVLKTKGRMYEDECTLELEE